MPSAAGSTGGRVFLRALRPRGTRTPCSGRSRWSRAWSHSFQPRRSASALGDVGAAAAVFAVDGNDSNHVRFPRIRVVAKRCVRHHNLTRHLLRTGRGPPRSFFFRKNESTNMTRAIVAQQQIGIHVGQRGCLGNDGAVDDGIGDFAGLDGIGSGSDDAGGQASGSVGQSSWLRE